MCRVKRFSHAVQNNKAFLKAWPLLQQFHFIKGVLFSSLLSSENPESLKCHSASADDHRHPKRTHKQPFQNHLCVMTFDQQSKIALKDLLKVTCACRSVIAV